MLEAYVPNEGTAWTHAREELRRFFERVLTRHREDAAPAAAPRRTGRAVRGRAAHGGARRHRRATWTWRSCSDSAPPRCTWRWRRTWMTPASRPSRIRRSTGDRTTSRCATWSARRCACCATAWSGSRNGIVEDARRLVGGQEQVLKVFEPYLGQRLTGLQIRTHGDYHLEQGALHRQGLRHHRLRRASRRRRWPSAAASTTRCATSPA